jgi:hypothetical protein
MVWLRTLLRKVALHEAVRAGNAVEVKRLLADSVDKDAKGE